MIGSLSDCSMIDWFSFWFPDWSVHWWLNYSIHSCFHNVMILVLRNASLGNRFAGAGKLSTARTRDAVARWQNRFCTCVLILEIALKSRIIIRQNGVRSGFMHGQWIFFFYDGAEKPSNQQAARNTNRLRRVHVYTSADGGRLIVCERGHSWVIWTIQ